jgi:hypothetical protein
VFPRDLPGVNPATLNKMLLYYRLMTKWSGLDDSTELSRMGLSHSPDRQVFMTTNETLGPSGTQPDRFLEDISADELSKNAPTNETSDDGNA